MREAPVTDIRRLAYDFADAIERELAQDVVLLGYCSGALLAYELTFELRRRRRLRVLHLVPIAQKAPSSPFTREPVRDIRAELHAIGGTDESLLNNDEMIELLRPAIEADFEMVAKFRRRRERRLEMPITVFVSSQDASSNRDAAAAWAEETTGRFELIELEGDHFFLRGGHAALATAVGANVFGDSSRLQ